MPICFHSAAEAVAHGAFSFFFGLDSKIPIVFSRLRPALGAMLRAVRGLSGPSREHLRTNYCLPADSTIEHKSLSDYSLEKSSADPEIPNVLISSLSNLKLYACRACCPVQTLACIEV